MIPTSKTLRTQAQTVLNMAKQRQCAIITAESCTGGLLGALLTEIPGSSETYLGGWITYANSAKQHALGVDDAIIAQCGAVSEETARTMAMGAITHAKQWQTAQTLIAVAITGIAGPGGGSKAKPVGRVHIAAAHEKMLAINHRQYDFEGTRRDIRYQSAAAALKQMQEIL